MMKTITMTLYQTSHSRTPSNYSNNTQNHYKDNFGNYNDNLDVYNDPGSNGGCDIKPPL